MSGRTAPRIYNLGTRWKQLHVLTALSLGNKFSVSIGSLLRPRSGLGRYGKERKKNPVAARNRNSVIQPAPIYCNWTITNNASGTVENKPPLCSDS